MIPFAKSDGEIKLPGRVLNCSLGDLLGPWSNADLLEFEHGLAAIEKAEHDAAIEPATTRFS